MVGQTALACDLNFVTACIAAGVAAILLAWRNFTAAWDVGTLGFLSIFHSHFSILYRVRSPAVDSNSPLRERMHELRNAASVNWRGLTPTPLYAMGTVPRVDITALTDQLPR